MFFFSGLRVGSITSRCSGEEPALLPRGRTQKAAEIEPRLRVVPNFSFGTVKRPKHASAHEIVSREEGLFAISKQNKET